MKKIIFIAFAAILAGFAISCQKEEAVSDKADAVQYTFNITVNDRVGFDSEVSTKGATAPKYKSAWENGDKIFLFFKPTEGSLPIDRYATLTYHESSWVGKVTEGNSSLGNGGTLSAVYVYKLDGSVTPAYSDSKWTIPTGNTFYNCQTEVNYTVSGNEISASLELKAPDDFVCFSIYDTSGDALTCDKVKGWKNVVIGSEMTFSNATCTGYMTGFDNIGESNYKDYYGRIVGGGTTLKGVTCKFSVVNDGKVYERTATPSSDKRSFYMDRKVTGDKKWTEAAGKLPGLFTVGKGADGIAGTVDDVQVRFSQGNLWYGPATEDASATFNFEKNQYDSTPASDVEYSWSSSHISHFYWSEDYAKAIAQEYYDLNASESDIFFTNATDTTAKADFTVNGQTNVWRTLSHDEWNYLFENHNYNHDKYVSVNGKSGIVIAPDGFSGTIADSYSTTDWPAAESNGLVFLPNTGYRSGTNINETEMSCIYWTSTAVSDKAGNAYRMFFQGDDSTLSTEFDDGNSRGWAVGIRLVTE